MPNVKSVYEKKKQIKIQNIYGKHNFLMSFTKKYQNSCFPIYCCFSTPTGIFTYIYIILWYYTLWPKVYIYTQLYKYNVYMSFTKKIPMHNPHSYNVRYLHIQTPNIPMQQQHKEKVHWFCFNESAFIIPCVCVTCIKYIFFFLTWMAYLVKEGSFLMIWCFGI